jgi:cytochrome c5
MAIALSLSFRRLNMKALSLIGLVSVLSCLSGCGDKTLALGEEVYKGTCIACHAQGINGAPILGNQKMWGKRLPQGIPVLVEHASNGYGLMPAKGGNIALTEEQMTAAVTYMVSRVQN